MPAPAELARNTEQLLQVLKKGEAIVIAGTGVSASVAWSNELIRSWPLLLKHGVDFCCEHCHDTKDVSDQCRLFDATKAATLDELLAVGDEVQDYLTKNSLMEEWLEMVFAALSPEDERLIRAIEKLHIPIATTNYDHLFEDITRLRSISWRDTAKLHKFLNGNERAILHLHGHFRDPQSIILGKRSYGELLEKDFAQFAQQSLFSRYNVVFVGFGDSTKDPNFSRLLVWSRKYLSATRIFRVVRESELDKLADEHKTLGYNIQLVSYGTNYSDLPAFLEGLAYQLPEEPPIPANLREGCPDNIGRGPLIETVVNQMILAPPAGKPIALLGTGGIGKTNTVLNALFHRRTAIHFGEHRYLVRCDGVTTPDLLWIKTLESLGLQPTPHQKPQQQVEAFLAKPIAVLVFDNAETPFAHFQAEMDALLLRLKTLPALKFVVTYRGKAMPGVKMGWHGIPIPALTDEQAKSLFLNITGDQFANDPDLPDLLREVDYLPLAVTLLAERAKDYNIIGDLFRKWQQKRTDLLNIAPDQKDLNLEVSVLLSFDSPRLTDESRELFKALCWLPGGLPRRLWEEAFPNHEDDQNALLRAALVDEDATGRLRVLAPVREVISRKFGADKIWLDRTITHFLNYVRYLGEQIGSDTRANELLQAEWNNLNMIWSHYEYNEIVLGALADTALFSRITGQYNESYLTKGIGVAQTNKWNNLWAFLLVKQSELYFLLSRKNEATICLQKANEIYDRQKNIAGQASCLFHLGNIYVGDYEYDNAKEMYQKALELISAGNDLLTQANIIIQLGVIYTREYNYTLAEISINNALALYHRIGAKIGVANCLTQLGHLYKNRNQIWNSVEKYQEALKIYESIGDTIGQANSLRSLGITGLKLFGPDKALPPLTNALNLYRIAGEIQGEGNCLRMIGDCYLDLKNLDQANFMYEQALVILREINDPLGISSCLYGLGHVAYQKGNFSQGESLLKDSIKLSQSAAGFANTAKAYLLLAQYHTDELIVQQMRCEAKKAFETAGLSFEIERYHLTNVC